MLPVQIIVGEEKREKAVFLQVQRNPCRARRFTREEADYFPSGPTWTSDLFPSVLTWAS